VDRTDITQPMLEKGIERIWVDDTDKVRYIGPRRLSPSDEEGARTVLEAKGIDYDHAVRRVGVEMDVIDRATCEDCHNDVGAIATSGPLGTRAMREIPFVAPRDLSAGHCECGGILTFTRTQLREIVLSDGNIANEGIG
jgi:hypothetical protein